MIEVGDVVTERLLARRPVKADLEGYIRFWTDPRVPEEVWPSSMRTTDDARRVLGDTIDHWERFGYGAWTVIERDTERIVGRVGLRNTELEGEPHVELAWFVDPDVWGRGYATEIAREGVREGFQTLGLDELIAMTATANAASQKVMQKLGFTYDTETLHAGMPHVVYRLRRPTA